MADAISRCYGINATPVISYSDPKYGDFSTNVALQLAAELKTPAIDVAQQLIKQISNDAITSVTEAKGFLNIRVRGAIWQRQLAAINSGFANNSSGQGKRVLVEFVSANPTGPLTLGNGRGGYGGDVLANILAASGYAVTREYYVNDAGSQVDKLATSVRMATRNERQQLDYRGEYVTELAGQFESQLASPTLGTELTAYIIDQLVKPPLHKMGIIFNNWFTEKQQLYREGKVDKMLKVLKEKQLTEEKNSAIWLKSIDGKNRDRVLVKSDGSYTYLLVDIAYHWNKLVERKYDKALNLWGADHAGQVPSLQTALKQIGLAGRLDIIVFQLVRLIKAGKVVKVSKRAGNYVTLEELLNEIPTDVARFFFLMRSFDTHMDFDLDLAKQQNQKNPYYYVMYTYVRAVSLLNEASKHNLMPVQSPSVELTQKERVLIRQLSKLPDIVVEIASSYEVHHLAFYGIELAKLFHDFYEDGKIIDLEKTAAESKLHLVAQVITVLEAYFKLLGIKPLDRM